MGAAFSRENDNNSEIANYQRTVDEIQKWECGRRKAESRGHRARRKSNADGGGLDQNSELGII